MAAPPESTKPTVENAPESPTTARPLEMDDDDVQEAGVITEEGPINPGSGPGPAESDVPPPKPPRPLTEQQKNELMLKEAFPDVDEPVIKAVLSASNGRIERAFHALLEMTDPDAVKNDTRESPPPPQPPRPVAAAGTTAQSQLEADELYARQLAEHYDNVGAYEERTRNRDGRSRRQQTGLKPNEMYGDRDHSFIDDDLPAIKEGLKKGFLETQTKVNAWITHLKKKIDENFDDDEAEGSRPGQAQHGRRPGEASRRSGDYERYDADPRVITDDFAGMKLSSDGTPVRDQRPLANPNLFRPPPPSTSPKPGSGRKVAFRDEEEQIDAYDSSPKVPPKDVTSAAAGRPSKWQPLSTVEPSPIADNDPFSLGDSEDEKDAKDKTGSKDANADDAERLRRAAAEAMADSLVDSKPKDETAKK